jgi:hypothetical protein
VPRLAHFFPGLFANRECGSLTPSANQDEKGRKEGGLLLFAAPYSGSDEALMLWLFLLGTVFLSAFVALCVSWGTCLLTAKGWRWWLAGLAVSLGSAVLGGFLYFAVIQSFGGKPCGSLFVLSPVIGFLTGFVGGGITVSAELIRRLSMVSDITPAIIGAAEQRFSIPREKADEAVRLPDDSVFRAADEVIERQTRARCA